MPQVKNEVARPERIVIVWMQLCVIDVRPAH